MIKDDGVSILLLSFIVKCIYTIEIIDIYLFIISIII